MPEVWLLFALSCVVTLKTPSFIRMLFYFFFFFFVAMNLK